MKSLPPPVLGAALALSFGAVSANQPTPRLSLPIDCTIGNTCFVQQFVDRDPGPGAVDYTCGGATYDGHKGVDIRLQTMSDIARDVPVLAAAAGRVTAIRDGERDFLARTPEAQAAVEGRECGNGLVIDHNDGWETQYCHLRENSIAVAVGDQVSTGDRLGSVGASGLAAFPHIHIAVRREGEVVDPFTGEAAQIQCGGDVANALWTKHAVTTLLSKSPFRQPIAIGFASRAVSLAALEERLPEPPSPTSPALVAYAWAINLKAGDVMTIILEGPEGPVAQNTMPALDRDKAQFMTFAGKRLRSDAWPRGLYVAKLLIENDGEVIHETISRMSF